MPLRLFNWTLWRKTTYYRKSGFRIKEESESRIVLQKRNYGLLLGGLFFVSMGIGIAWLGFSEASGETATLVMILVFASLCALLGGTITWASRTQRDSIVVDRNLGTVRSERAKNRRRAGDEPFSVAEHPLDDLTRVELRVGSGSASLSLLFRSHSSLTVDYATDIEHLKALGTRLAATAGVELRLC